MTQSDDVVQEGVLLSVRPRFARALLSGSKRVELRRRAVRLKPGQLIAVYEASPTSALAGFLIVAATYEATPAAVWTRCNSGMSLSRTEYDKYLRGSERAFAIEVKHAIRLEIPVSLLRLRRQCLGFRPPQSFRYLGTLPVALGRLFREALVNQVSAVSRRNGMLLRGEA